ncbi:Gfo/Idh/MocA family protein [Tuwongella immobilis]|uniref:Gfo/Idh/MocA-like oxidoreductase N-terminal domain-containing protein n=1 Tax=Tuwongella immobilis TaxID=692036 RepID=A0A6C2YUL8_9BACT|nr:Gfo/Idh/MocA family oxidoreductase [Tuwongella immobilis]VIP05134.1 oxidoreductase : Putative dehydrogenase OS=Singulisphaera acidiphila (strain ATCC BAA-1392 / DSM 18658 / VKM B-2454 / MOB10) GN=Sinac_1916 PE=4 SV=1: GFO_IDH_MocA [Tuwongella immobilis]VTS07624.1 oxidoreductase : Putative dehydrogenase OS=Singulisphaera acidiphila (strain ATCC BAA-1392 / DSM 18658 / VKM B-2454 / MOB10) GN=Sinac_1916 PE=4 SV=1: GFO_IDH_MocA [Tuwongella immobilis]
MSQPFLPNHLPRLPQRRDFRIGCIGAGFIMRDCHLVAYRQAGFHPLAITSRNPDRAREVATHHQIPRVYATVDDLLADRDLEVIDIAVPPDRSLEMILRTCEHADHVRGILAQKPLALNVRDAKRAVAACRDAGIVLAVNQNMRFDQSIRAMAHLLQERLLGEPVLATIEMRAIPHWMPWSEQLPSLATFVMSIHHLDTFRYWFGNPDRILASTRPDPRTRFPHVDGLNLVILEYDSGLRASSWDDVWAGPAREGAAADLAIRWRVEGTRGMAQGTIGWPSYPQRQPSTLAYTTCDSPTWIQPQWSEVWFPDAFVGTMAQLLVALETGQPPEISGEDNLGTIALCEAVFAAATQHRITTLSEFGIG